MLIFICDRFRPQDLATKITGTVTSKKGSKVIHGDGTVFTKDVKVGSTVLVSKLSISAKVAEIHSDTQISLVAPLRAKDTEEGDGEDGCENATAKCIPQIDHSDMFEVTPT